MKAIRISRTGGPEVLDIVEVPVPRPGPGEVLVRVHSIGVAYFDMLIRSGRYPWMPPLPYVLGNEVSGNVVDASGTDLKEGQPVYLTNWDNGYRGGLYAECVVASEDAVRPLSANVDLDRAAALGNYIVAQCLLDYSARGIELRRMLVHGAAGGMGTALIELGLLAGAQVIGLASSDEKCTKVRSLGAEAINYNTEDTNARVKALTDGHGVDLICNHVAGDTFGRDLTMLAPFGLVVSYGVLKGMPEQNLFVDMRKSINHCPAVRCFTMHVFDDHPEWRDRCTEKVLHLFAENKIRPVLGPILPLTQAAQAHRLLEQRGVIGKIVLRP